MGRPSGPGHQSPFSHRDALAARTRTPSEALESRVQHCCRQRLRAYRLAARIAARGGIKEEERKSGRRRQETVCGSRQMVFVLHVRIPFLLEPVKIETNFLPYDRFDFMGDMAFGGGFELMRDGGDREGIWKLMEDALEFVPLELVLGFKVLISSCDK